MSKITTLHMHHTFAVVTVIFILLALPWIIIIIIIKHWRRPYLHLIFASPFTSSSHVSFLSPVTMKSTNVFIAELVEYCRAYADGSESHWRPRSHKMLYKGWDGSGVLYILVMQCFPVAYRETFHEGLDFSQYAARLYTKKNQCFHLRLRNTG